MLWQPLRQLAENQRRDYQPRLIPHRETVLTLSAEESIPAGLADAFEGFVAGAVLATWQRDALVALFPGVANATAALARPLAVAIHRITATPAHGHLAEITLPAGQALHIALLVARVVRVHLVLLRLLAGLPGGGAGGGGSSAREGELKELGYLHAASRAEYSH